MPLEWFIGLLLALGGVIFVGFFISTLLGYLKSIAESLKDIQTYIKEKK